VTGEIEERSRSSAEHPFDMASLLDNILARHSPLTIGYGGWEGDVVMTALRRRLRSVPSKGEFHPMGGGQVAATGNQHFQERRYRPCEP
jgi:hypothetical protein